MIEGRGFEVLETIKDDLAREQLLKEQKISERIDELIAESKIVTARVFSRTLLMAVKFPNEFEMIAYASVVKEKEFDYDIGKANCLKRVKKQMRMAMDAGYLK
ncbi:hypothetical protein BpsS140_00016 [Bacillus phage vB_BpsS-140]|nr:hypothetical protein BpsS140_00016 [Bacillus phage vB_BpsS-140]